jgi:uncharacterized membrane protein YhdT
MNLRISILPKTSLGRWSVGLAIAFILFWVLAGVLSGLAGVVLLGPGFNRVLAVILTIVFVGMSGAALVTGLISMIKNRERSVLVFVSMVIGFWGVLGWGVGAWLI